MKCYGCLFFSNISCSVVFPICLIFSTCGQVSKGSSILLFCMYYNSYSNDVTSINLNPSDPLKGILFDLIYQIHLTGAPSDCETALPSVAPQDVTSILVSCAMGLEFETFCRFSLMKYIYLSEGEKTVYF